MKARMQAGIRYARAILIAAEETGVIEQVRQEILSLRGLLAESPELDTFLRNPTIGGRDKHTVLDQLFREKLSPFMWSVIELLVRKRREPLLADILRKALALIDEHQGRVVATVRVAEPLTDEQRVKFERHLSGITGKQVIVTDETDPTIITGFVARLGDIVYDASLAVQLKRLHRRLLSADLSPMAR